MDYLECKVLGVFDVFLYNNKCDKVTCDKADDRTAQNIDRNNSRGKPCNEKINKFTVDLMRIGCSLYTFVYIDY